MTDPPLKPRNYKAHFPDSGVEDRLLEHQVHSELESQSLMVGLNAGPEKEPEDDDY